MCRFRYAFRFALISWSIALWIISGGIICGRSDASDEKNAASSGVERIDSDGVENLIRVSPKIYSGSQPDGEAGFEALKRLGVRTIISVDGAAPDLPAARRAGLRYVHIPIGYDGISAAQALKIIKAVRELPGPVFVHCHHGKHRGPAAAAICAVSLEGWSRERATGWMRAAGTSPDYKGLFRSVGTLPLPTAEETRASTIELPEQAPVSSLVETMVQIDHDWERLKVLQQVDFRQPVGESDPTAGQTALQLAERFREMKRLEPGKNRGVAFAAAVREASIATDDLEKALARLARSDAAAVRDAAQSAFRQVAKNCLSCHRKFRDE